MSFEIYYFSGTGNSLYAAKEIAKQTGGVLTSIASVIDAPSVNTGADSVGIVFPCYLAQLYGIPLIVERFVNKLEDPVSKYIFAVCTFGGYEAANAVPTLKNLSKLVRSAGGRLSGEFSVRLPMNNLDYSHLPPINTDSNVMYRNSVDKINEICRRIKKKKNDKNIVLNSFAHLLLSPLYGILKKYVTTALKQKAKEDESSKLNFHELIPMTDKSITVSDKCTGCGICEKVCPVHNIRMRDQRPSWSHHCEMCFACDEWCPEGAIQHWSRAKGIKYHHPEIKLEDMLGKCLPKGSRVRRGRI